MTQQRELTVVWQTIADPDLDEKLRTTFMIIFEDELLTDEPASFDEGPVPPHD